ncbi:hypothetical protein PLICRDRAFT_695179 [Plicaturopsis crispa FD-325 SS-3]|nr:hypothetical protein PLICRDRAFT_695179 [Plicaturopsis crispa FD-325 SS-3]
MVYKSQPARVAFPKFPLDTEFISLAFFPVTDNSSHIASTTAMSTPSFYVHPRVPRRSSSRSQLPPSPPRSRKSSEASLDARRRAIECAKDFYSSRQDEFSPEYESSKAKAHREFMRARRQEEEKIKADVERAMQYQQRAQSRTSLVTPSCSPGAAPSLNYSDAYSPPQSVGPRTPGSSVSPRYTNGAPSVGSSASMYSGSTHGYARSRRVSMATSHFPPTPEVEGGYYGPEKDRRSNQYLMQQPSPPSPPYPTSSFTQYNPYLRRTESFSSLARGPAPVLTHAHRQSTAPRR